MKELICNILGISYYDNKVLIDYYLQKSINDISIYINKKDINLTQFETQIVDLAVYYYQQRGSVGIASMSQGGRSVSFEKGIPESIRKTLPRYGKVL